MVACEEDRIPSVITTARLSLVPHELRHSADLFEYGSRETFTKYLDAAPFLTERDAVRFIESLQSDNRSGKRSYWVAEQPEGGRAIGTLGLIFPYVRHHRVAEIGYGFSPD